MSFPVRILGLGSASPAGDSRSRLFSACQLCARTRSRFKIKVVYSHIRAKTQTRNLYPLAISTADSENPPAYTGLVFFRLGIATSRLDGALMGEMKRAIAREREAWAEQMQEQTRMKSTLVIAAAIIAAVRLARDQDISRPSPRLTAVVSDSVNLARMILDRVGRQ
jgi:hypothetical protein